MTFDKAKKLKFNHLLFGSLVKLSVLLLWLLLAGCDQLSSKEERFLGHWTWAVNHEGLRENGFLILNRNKTYQYKINSCVRSECLGEEADGLNGIWVISDESICFASEFSKRSIFNEAIISKKRCIFHNVFANDHLLTFNLIGFFYNGEIKAMKQ